MTGQNIRSAAFFLILFFWASSAGFWPWSGPCVKAADEPVLKYDGVWLLGFNLRSAAFTGPNSLLFRRAIAGAIDRAALAKNIFGETITPNGFIPPGMPGYEAALPGQVYDPARSAEVFKSLGQRLPKQIILIHTDGDKTIAAAKAIQSDLAKAGLAIQLRQTSYDDFSSFDLMINQIKKNRVQMFLMGFKADIPWATLSLLQPLFYSQGSQNFTGYKNPKVDNLLEAAQNFSDRPSQTKILSTVDQLISEDLPAVGLFYIKLMADNNSK